MRRLPRSSSFSTRLRSCRRSPWSPEKPGSARRRCGSRLSTLQRTADFMSCPRVPHRRGGVLVPGVDGSARRGGRRRFARAAAGPARGPRGCIAARRLRARRRPARSGCRLPRRAAAARCGANSLVLLSTTSSGWTRPPCRRSGTQSRGCATSVWPPCSLSATRFRSGWAAPSTRADSEQSTSPV